MDSLSSHLREVEMVVDGQLRKVKVVRVRRCEAFCLPRDAVPACYDSTSNQLTLEPVSEKSSRDTSCSPPRGI